MYTTSPVLRAEAECLAESRILASLSVTGKHSLLLFCGVDSQLRPQGLTFATHIPAGVFPAIAWSETGTGSDLTRAEIRKHRFLRKLEDYLARMTAELRRKGDEEGATTVTNYVHAVKAKLRDMNQRLFEAYLPVAPREPADSTSPPPTEAEEALFDQIVRDLHDYIEQHESFLLDEMRGAHLPPFVAPPPPVPPPGFAELPQYWNPEWLISMTLPKYVFALAEKIRFLKQTLSEENTATTRARDGFYTEALQLLISHCVQQAMTLGDLVTDSGEAAPSRQSVAALRAGIVAVGEADRTILERFGTVEQEHLARLPGLK